MRYNKLEGFSTDIPDRVNQIADGRYAKAHRKQQVSPVLSAGSEGFEDIGMKTDAPPPSSTSAPTSEASNTTKQTDADAAAVVAAAVSAATTAPSASASASASPAATATGVTGPSAATSAAPTGGTAGLASAATAGFRGDKDKGLFKLGEMPSENKSGPFVDVASTLNNAMSSLKPDQMAAMTAESKSLMETQRNLMNMLQSMAPVLQDGRQLLDSFSGIFGGLNGILPAK